MDHLAEYYESLVADVEWWRSTVRVLGEHGWEISELGTWRHHTLGTGLATHQAEAVCMGQIWRRMMEG